MKNSYDPRHFDVAIGTFNGCAEEREINRVKLDDAVKRWTRTTKERIRFFAAESSARTALFYHDLSITGSSD